jgi:hypothetical protein
MQGGPGLQKFPGVGIFLDISHVIPTLVENVFYKKSLKPGQNGLGLLNILLSLDEAEEWHKWRSTSIYMGAPKKLSPSGWPPRPITVNVPHMR